MIRATDEAMAIDHYVGESRERIESIESIADDIARMLRATDAEVPR